MIRKILPMVLLSTLTLSCRDLVHAETENANESSTTEARDVHPTTRFQPVLFEVKAGYSYPSKWNASFVVMAIERNLRLGVFILGPYDKYITNEMPKTNMTAWGISAGWSNNRWRSKMKGSGLDVYLGSANTDRDLGNIPWNFGFQLNGTYSIYTDRKGSYAIALTFQSRRMYVVSNKDQHGVAYDSSQKGSWVFSGGIVLFM